VRPSILPLLLVGFACAAGARSEPADASADADRIARLIAQLGSPQFADREKANETLADLGQPALAALQRARQGSDPEVRRRAEVIVQRIERRVDTAEVLKPSHLRLVFKDMPLDAAIEALSERTGLQVSVEGDRRQERVTLDTGTVTLWQAYEDFCGRVGLAEKVRVARVERSRGNLDGRGTIVIDTRNMPTDSNDHRRVLTTGRSDRTPTFLDGALRLKALPVTHGADTQGQDVAFLLDVATEPRLQWQTILGVKITRAVDNRGQARVQPTAFVAGANTASVGDDVLIIVDSEGGLPWDHLRTVPVRLGRGKESAQRLKEVKGILTAVVRSPVEELATVDVPPRQLNHTIDGRKGHDIVVKSFEQGDEVLRMHVQVGWPQQEGPTTMGPGRVVRVNRGFRGRQAAPVAEEGEPTPMLLDKDGKRPQTAVSFLIGREQRGDRIVATYLLTFQREQGVHEPVKVQVTGRRNVLIEAPFVFKDVPLAE
jgi:hypothetical protein